MTNAVLQLVLSYNLFIGVNAIFISHLFLSDAKSLASTSTCMYMFKETLVRVLKNIIWQTRCGLIAYNTIHMTKLKKKTMCWLTPQLPVVSNSFNRGNILKSHTVVLFQCGSQISIMLIIQLWCSPPLWLNPYQQGLPFVRCKWPNSQLSWAMLGKGLNTERAESERQAKLEKG